MCACLCVSVCGYPCGSLHASLKPVHLCVYLFTFSSSCFSDSPFHSSALLCLCKRSYSLSLFFFPSCFKLQLLLPRERKQMSGVRHKMKCIWMDSSSHHMLINSIKSNNNHSAFCFLCERDILIGRWGFVQQSWYIRNKNAHVDKFEKVCVSTVVVLAQFSFSAEVSINQNRPIKGETATGSQVP